MTYLKIKTNEVIKEILYLILIPSLFWFVYLMGYNLILRMTILTISILFSYLIFFKILIFKLLNLRV